jgi:hypothetical protein
MTPMGLYCHFLMLLVLLTSANALAQPPKRDSVTAGIFLTYQDFEAGTLSYSVNCSREKQKIRLHDNFQKPFIDVVNKEKHVRLQKSELYAYCDCEHNLFRFFCNEEFQLAEMAPITIYVRQDYNYTMGTSMSEDLFYFSPGPDADIYPLTIQHLRIVYQGNSKFHKLVDENIKRDCYLSQFDYAKNRFEVNILYQLSLQ